MIDGRLLRDMRRKAELSVEQLAKKTGLSTASIEKIEAGQRSKLHDATLLALAHFFKMKMVDFEKLITTKEEKGKTDAENAGTAPAQTA